MTYCVAFIVWLILVAVACYSHKGSYYSFRAYFDGRKFLEF
jgi:hypothetical protein